MAVEAMATPKASIFEIVAPVRSVVIAPAAIVPTSAAPAPRVSPE
jgi:hypothetical protein